MNIIKDKVVDFYTSGGILSESSCVDILHKDVQLEWYSSKGYLQLKFSDILSFSKDLRESYADLRAEVHNVIATETEISLFCTYFVKTNENPEEEIILGCFMVQWQIKDKKLYKGWQMSQSITK